MSNALLTHISSCQSEQKACQKHFSHTFHIIYTYIYIHTKVKGSQSEQNACQHHSCADLDKYTPTSWIKTREQSEQTACQDTHLPHKIAELLASLGQEKYEWNSQDPAKQRPNAPTTPQRQTLPSMLHADVAPDTKGKPGMWRRRTPSKAMPGQMLAARCKTQTTE